MQSYYSRQNQTTTHILITNPPHIPTHTIHSAQQNKQAVWLAMTDWFMMSPRHRNERLTSFSAASNKRRHSCPRHRCFENSSLISCFVEKTVVFSRSRMRCCVERLCGCVCVVVYVWFLIKIICLRCSPFLWNDYYYCYYYVWDLLGVNVQCGLFQR